MLYLPTFPPARAYPFPQEGSEDFHGPTLNFRSVYWTNPLFVDIKSPPPSLTGHSRLGAMERHSITLLCHHPPRTMMPPRSYRHHRVAVGQPSVLTALLVVNPDSNATGVVGSGKRKVGQGRSGKPVSLSRHGGIFYSLLVSRQPSVLATLLVVNPDPDATGVVGMGKRKVGQGRSGKPVSLSRRGGIFYSLSVLRTIMPTVVVELQWGHNVNACTLHAIFMHAFAYQIIPLFLLLSRLNIVSDQHTEELVKSTTSASKAPKNKTLRLEAQVSTKSTIERGGEMGNRASGMDIEREGDSKAPEARAQACVELTDRKEGTLGEGGDSFLLELGNVKLIAFGYYNNTIYLLLLYIPKHTQWGSCRAHDWGLVHREACSSPNFRPDAKVPPHDLKHQIGTDSRGAGRQCCEHHQRGVEEIPSSSSQGLPIGGGAVALGAQAREGGAHREGEGAMPGKYHPSQWATC
ncbi:hypothetical protein EDB87DRAFT_1581703 [Lactarius vividus]|nr:hypothetical protein EDB87DRAFT_1581703 [Lactarius vividus]